MRIISLDKQVQTLLVGNAPVAVGVSGGKDSCAVAFAVSDHLDEIGHTGERILIHSDLGLVEWKDSLPTCERLAQRLGWELVVVRRAAGGMMERWEGRWQNNMERYRTLSCVKLILPWSTASMRFCTAELKRDVICRDLVTRFPGRTILSVSGIRRDESPKRKKAPVTKAQPKMTSAKWMTAGWDWHPILEWTKDEVFAYLAEKNFPVHEAYTKYGSSRVSCSFCILGSRADLRASVRCPDNQDIYRRMVDLEISSGYAFQDKQWLGDVAPELLSDERRYQLLEAKRIASAREEAEAAIPEHLLYVNGWPIAVPTTAEAALLAAVRQTVGKLYGWQLECLTAAKVRSRYKELMSLKESKA